MQVKVRAIVGTYGFGPLRFWGDTVWLGTEGEGSDLLCDTLGPYLTSYDTVKLYVWDEPNEPYADRVVVTSGAGSCTPTWLPAITVQQVSGPYRIGATIREDGTGNQRLRFGLFHDDSTSTTLTIGGRQFTSTFIPGPPIELGASTGITWWRHHIATSLFTFYPPTDYTVVEISGFKDGVETSTGDPISWYGTYDRLGDMYDSLIFRPAKHYTADCLVKDAGNGTPTGNLLVTGGADTHTLANGTFAAYTDWSGTYPFLVSAALTGDWSSGGVDPYPADQPLDALQIMPKTPGAGPGSWTPISLSLAASLSVLRSTNPWSATGAVNITGSTFDVHETGCTVSRPLKSFWRNWNTPGDPKYHSDDAWTTTKADYYGSDGQDIWGWGLYAYLDVDLTASVSGSLVLTVRSATAPGGDTYDRSYTIPATSGRHTYRVDVLFPQGGGPFYCERVELLTLSNLAVATYTVHSLTLVADEQAYVKVSGSGLTLALDGSFPVAFWNGDTFNFSTQEWQKDHQNGLFQTDSGVTSFGGATRFLGLSLSQIASHWSRMEGVTATYSGTALEAGLTDSYGNVAGTDEAGVAKAVARKASWLHDVLPAARLTAGSSSSLAASVRGSEVEIVPAPAGTFYLTFVKTLGTVLEALAVTPSKARGAAGATVKAKRSTSGIPAPGDPEMGGAVTDASGFVQIAVRNGTASSAEFTAYLEGA